MQLIATTLPAGGADVASILNWILIAARPSADTAAAKCSNRLRLAGSRRWTKECGGHCRPDSGRPCSRTDEWIGCSS